MCASCGRTDLELLNRINKPVVDPGEGGGQKEAYTASVIFGRWGACGALTDPAPHLVWGS